MPLAVVDLEVVDHPDYMSVSVDNAPLLCMCTNDDHFIVR